MKKILSITFACAILLTSVACGSGSGASANTVTFAKENDVVSMDSTYATDGFSFEAIAATVDGLMSVAADGSIIPAIASKVDISEDGKKYTFTLRDASWDNGTKVTAKDFVYSWQRAIGNNKAEYRYLFTGEAASVVNAEEIIEGTKTADALGIKAIDDTTLEVTLTKPVSFFESLMTFPVFYPVNQEFAESKGDQFALTPENMLANGPYKMKSWQQNSKITFDKNATYWDAANVKTDTLVFNIIPDFSTAALDFESGKLDFTKLNSTLVDKYKTNEAYNTVLEGYLWYQQYNFENQYLKNENLRMALSLSVDRSDLTANVLKDGSIDAAGFVPKGLATGVDGKDFRETSDTYLAYDLEKAKEYWAKAKEELGVTTLELSLLFEPTDPAKPAAEFMQSQWQTNLEGLTITMVAQPKKNRIEYQKEGKFDIVLTRWGPDFADPTTYLGIMITGNSYNYGKYTNTAYDALVSEVGTTTDLTKRWDLMKQAEAIMLKDASVSPVFQVGGAALVNPKLKGLETHAVGVPYRYKNIYLEKE